MGESSRVPQALLIGRCIEVWEGASVVDYGPTLSAFRRWSAARRWWLETAGIESVADQCALIPLGGPWSLEQVTKQSQAERLGKGGSTLDDIDDLRVEAIKLVERADRGRTVSRRD